MRTTRQRWWGVLMVAAVTACGEAVAPAAPSQPTGQGQPVGGSMRLAAVWAVRPPRSAPQPMFIGRQVVGQTIDEDPQSQAKAGQQDQKHVGDYTRKCRHDPNKGPKPAPMPVPLPCAHRGPSALGAVSNRDSCA